MRPPPSTASSAISTWYGRNRRGRRPGRSATKQSPRRAPCHPDSPGDEPGEIFDLDAAPQRQERVLRRDHPPQGSLIGNSPASDVFRPVRCGQSDFIALGLECRISGPIDIRDHGRPSLFNWNEASRPKLAILFHGTIELLWCHDGKLVRYQVVRIVDFPWNTHARLP